MKLLQDIAFYATLKEDPDYTNIDNHSVQGLIRKNIATILQDKFPDLAEQDNVLDACVEVYKQGYKDGRNQSGGAPPPQDGSLPPQ